AENLLGDIISEEAGTIVSVEDIQRIVAEFFGIGLADMTSKKRPANIAVPRMVAMYFARKLTSFSLPSIADKFQRNHATVLHAVSTVEKRGKEDEEFKRSLALLERKLAGL
ncbi:MAG: chromosomal replication initiator protein DnaA, partial [Victivallales bacterium]|nr:chromosomal replication initiator protein DnaA [Victivallales bacterium]